LLGPRQNALPPNLEPGNLLNLRQKPCFGQVFSRFFQNQFLFTWVEKHLPLGRIIGTKWFDRARGNFGYTFFITFLLKTLFLALFDLIFMGLRHFNTERKFSTAQKVLV
jgi:hypothetical protein